MSKLKLLLFAALLSMSTQLFAQSGALTLDNSQGKCGVWVKMLGIDPSVAADAAPCLLNSFNIYVPPFTVMCWNSVWEFQGTAAPTCGWPAIGWAFGVNIPAISTTFQWTDATFQWDKCGDCNAGGNLSNPCAPNCWGAGTSFIGVCPANTATLVPGCSPMMGNLTIIFHS